jgi:transcription factor SPN1
MDSDDDAHGAKDGDDSDKESAVGELIADIFGGSSDEDEEFEGFVQTDVAPAKKDKSAVVSSDDEDDTGPAPGSQSPSNIVPDLSSDDEADEAVKKQIRGEQDEDKVWDFDVMMQKKKEERGKQRRRKKDDYAINNSDDLIAELIERMKNAAEEDRKLNQEKKPAIKKLQMLGLVEGQLKKADLHEALLDGGILNAMTEWLAPLPDKSLPHLRIREVMLRALSDFPPVSSDSLKNSGVGKAVMYLYRHPKEIKGNKDLAGRMINDWSRPIFNLTSNYKSLTRQEREERDYAQLPKRRRLSDGGAMTPRRDIDKALKGEEKGLRPGDPGWIQRARVPLPSKKDYVVRPKWKVEEAPVKSTKKPLNKYEKHMKELQEKKKKNKAQRSVTISIEGRLKKPP